MKGQTFSMRIYSDTSKLMFPFLDLFLGHKIGFAIVSLFKVFFELFNLSPIYRVIEDDLADTKLFAMTQLAL